MKSNIVEIGVNVVYESTGDICPIKDPDIEKLTDIRLVGNYEGSTCTIRINAVEQRIDKGDKDHVTIYADDYLLQLLADGILSCGRDLMGKGEHEITLDKGKLTAWVNNTRGSALQDKAVQYMLYDLQLINKGYTTEKITEILSDEKHPKHAAMKVCYNKALASVKADAIIDTL